MRQHRFVRWLFIALALLQLVPIWSTHYLPTSDGPEHLYNSWVLHDLVTGRATPLIRSYFAVDWRPNPNWLGHLVMAILIAIVPPLIAEKILFSAIVLLFLAGAWIFAGADDPRSHTYAFLAFPFAFHQLLMDGFYNFSLSVAFWMIVAGFWWRRRNRPDARTIAATAGLLVLCYFSHPMSVALAMGSIGLLWLWTLRGRSLRTHAKHLIAFLPATLLLAWFTAQHVGKVLSDRRSLSSLFLFLARGQILFSFDPWQMIAGHALFVIFILIGIASIVERRAEARLYTEAKAFLLLLVCFLLLFFWSPSAFAGGTLLTERMALFVMLATLPCFSPGIAQRGRIAICAVMSLFAIAAVAYHTVHFRQSDRSIRTFVATMDAIRPDSTVLPLMFDRNAPRCYMGCVSHAPAYVALQKRLVDLDNYEPATGYFPLTYAKGVDDPSVFDIEAHPDKVQVSDYARRAQFIFTWQLPAKSLPLIGRLERDYQLISQSGPARVYKSRASFTTFQHPASILLPLSGTTNDIGMTVRWRIDQEIRNTGAKPVRVVLSTCSLTPCDFDIGSEQSVPIAGDEPYVIVRTEQSDAQHGDATTVLRRADPEGGGFHTAVPTVRESDFRDGALTFRNVPFSVASRLNLRMWVIHGGGRVAYSVRVLRNGQEAGNRMFATGETGFVVDPDLGGQFPQLNGGDIRVDLIIRPENVPPGARAWAFLTATDNRTNIPTLIYSER